MVVNIFNKVALQGLKKNRTRTLVTMIGVVLSAALITAVATFGVSLLNYMTKGALAKYGNWHVAFMDVSPSFAQEQAGNTIIACTTTFDNIGYASLDSSRNPNKPYLFIAGFRRETFAALPINLISGRLPENNKELLVSGKVATDGGFKSVVGDKLTLAVGSRINGSEKLGQSDPYTANRETFVPKGKKDYTIVGICQRPIFEEDSAPGYTLITQSETENSTDSLSLFVTLKNPRQVHSYTKSTGEQAYIFNDNVLRFMGLSENNLFNTLLYSFGGIVVAIIMVGSVFLIYNSFYISLNERTQQFGILSSVGATAKQLRNCVLFEGLCIGVVGIPIGVAVGIISIRIVVTVAAKNFANVLYDNIPLTLTVSVPAIVAAAAVSMVTILISAYIPAKKAANMPVMACIRQTNELRIESSAIKTAKITQRIYGLAGTLALKNFKRNKKRYRSIVLSLVLSIVLFISTSVLVTDMKQKSNQAAEFTDQDIYLSTQDMDDQEMLRLYDKLKTAKYITTSLYQELSPRTCMIKVTDLTDDYLRNGDSLSSLDETIEIPVDMQFLDDSTYLDIIQQLKLPLTEYTGQHAKLLAVSMLVQNGQTISIVKNDTAIAALTTNTKGESTIAKEQHITLAFVQIVPPDSPPVSKSGRQNWACFRILAPYSIKKKFETSDASAGIKCLSFQSTSPSQSVAEMEKLIISEGITAQYSLYNMYKMMDENRNYIFIVNIFAYTFIIMISLIAVANVFNTISTNIKLRRRELAMLRSIGMSERDFQKMMNFECIFYGIASLLIGLPIAVAASWLIHKNMVTNDIDFVMPWTSIGISVFSVLLIIFITMLYSISKIKKENIIDALRDDMT